MDRYRFSVFALCCGLWITLPTPLSAAARVEDKVTAIKDYGVLVTENHGDVALANIVVTDPDSANVMLKNFVGKSALLQSVATDRYGRTNAIVTPTGESITLQEILLRDGAALIYSASSFPQWKQWKKSERIVTRITPEATIAHHQEFALVEGKVTRTYQARDAYYINFGEDWKTDFSLKIPRKAWRSFGDTMNIPDGSLIRARGVIIAENGPMIVITTPDQLERIGHANAP